VRLGIGDYTRGKLILSVQSK
jgi:glc operon protein GlcG